jgi:hypothetical protein
MDGGDHAAEARVAQSRHPAARLAAPRFRPGAHDKGSHDIGEMSQDAGESRPIGVFGTSILVLFAAALMALFVVPTRADEAS